MTITRFCLIRHGETDWNAEKRYQGQLDIGLNAMGEAQARALGTMLTGTQFSAAYASDLQRAWRTAELALAGQVAAVPATGHFILPAPALRERHYGVFQGHTIAEMRIEHPEAHAHYEAREPGYDFETGESLTAFAQRVLSGLAALARAHRGGTVVAFTHGGVLDVVYRAAVGRDLSGPRDFSIPNTGINWLHLDEDLWRLDSWGDTRHLAALRTALDEATL